MGMNGVTNSRKVDAKIVIIGNAEVGKTSLMERFVYSKFTGRREQTIGATFVSKEFVRGNKSIVLAIWDTAGTERFWSMMNIYYRNAKAAILCFDLTDRVSWDVLRRWAVELRSKEQNCRLYICATKKDLIDDGFAERDIPEEKVNFYADGVGVPVIETSSKTGENVDRLFSMIADDLWDEVANSSTDANTVSLTSSQRKRWCCSSS